MWPLSNLLIGGKQGKFTDSFLFLDETYFTLVNFKEKFSSASMLRYFNSEKAVHLETNTSVFTIAGILCEANEVTIVVQTLWLREERGLSLCRPVAGTIGSAVGPKR